MVGGKRVAVPDEIKSLAIKRFGDGLSASDVARELGISSSFVSRLLSKAGCPDSGRGRSHNKKPDALIAEAIRLYKDCEMTIPQVAEALSIGSSTAARWIEKAGAGRSMSLAFALAITKGRKRPRGTVIPFQSSKTGEWHYADSRWEAVRMSQLDADSSVVRWSRESEFVSYVDASGKQRNYIPDLRVEYASGKTVVEEIKPKCRVSEDINLRKFSAAIEYYEKLGIGFQVITEDEIGKAAIAGFTLDGILSMPEAHRIERRRLMRNKADRKRRAARNSAKLSKYGGYRRKGTLEDRSKACELYLSGKTLIEVGRELSVSSSCVRNWLREIGVELRPAITRSALLKSSERTDGQICRN